MQLYLLHTLIWDNYPIFHPHQTLKFQIRIVVGKYWHQKWNNSWASFWLKPITEIVGEFCLKFTFLGLSCLVSDISGFRFEIRLSRQSIYYSIQFDEYQRVENCFHSSNILRDNSPVFQKYYIAVAAAAAAVVVVVKLHLIIHYKLLVDF